jgi:hypothetical protein
MSTGNHVTETVGSAAYELGGRGRRLALTEISVRLSVISRDLTAPRVSVDDLCKDVDDLTAAARRLHRIAENANKTLERQSERALSYPTAVTQRKEAPNGHHPTDPR